MTQKAYDLFNRQGQLSPRELARMAARAQQMDHIQQATGNQVQAAFGVLSSVGTPPPTPIMLSTVKIVAATMHAAVYDALLVPFSLCSLRIQDPPPQGGFTPIWAVSFMGLKLLTDGTGIYAGWKQADSWPPPKCGFDDLSQRPLYFVIGGWVQTGACQGNNVVLQTY